MIQHFAKLGVGIFFVLVAVGVQGVLAQEETRFQVAGIDTTQFPVVRINLITADSRSAPADLGSLTLSENGIPVDEFSLDDIAVGIDATFIIDANTGIEEIDDESGVSRREKVIAAIARFAAQYMNPDGLDHISIIVPGEDQQSGQFLVQNESDPQAVLEAIRSYQTLRPGLTQLNDMINLALEDLQQRTDTPRFQTIMLFSDARRLDEQLSYPLLVATANDSDIPIYGAILGLEADEFEQENMARLTEATQAFHLHMPQAEDVDPIFQIWEKQSNPVQLSYRSRQRQSGRNQITLNLGSIQAATEFDIALSAPEVEFSMSATEIERMGNAPDTPLESLQPQIQPLEIMVSWPDDLPRSLIEVLLLANNQAQRIPENILAESGSLLAIPWDISNFDAGEVELVVQVLDELGYRGQSAPQTITIQVDRPLPPTAIPIQEEEGANEIDETNTGLQRQTLNFLAVSGLLLLLFGGMTWFWRRRGSAEESANFGRLASHSEVKDGAETIVPLIPVLQSLSPGIDEEWILEGSNITFGSDRESADIVLEDESIGRLHARIRKREDTYWLFDEGSAAGVSLNYERLGLAPKELQDGDIVQLGTISLRFQLREEKTG